MNQQYDGHDDAPEESVDWLREAFVAQSPTPPREPGRATLARASARYRRRVRVGALVAAGVLIALGATALAVAVSGGNTHVVEPTDTGTCAPVSPTPRPTSDFTHDGDPGEYATYAASTPCAQDAADAVRDTMAGLDIGLLTDVHPGPAPAHSAGGEQLVATVTSAGRRDPRTDWLAEIAAGAIAERMADGQRSLDQVVSGIQLSDDPGSFDGLGDAATGQVFDAQRDNETDDQITAHVTAVLASFGVTVTDLEVLRPLGPVVSVTAQIADPATLAGGKFDHLTQQAFGEQFEGSFLEIDDRLGNRLVTTSSSSRAASGGVGFAPTIDGLWGITHGGLATFSQPPPQPTLDDALHRALPADQVRAYSGQTPPLLSGPGASSHLTGSAEYPLGITDLETAGADGSTAWHSVWIVAAQVSRGDDQHPTWTTEVAAYDTTTGDEVASGSYEPGVPN